MPIRPYLEGHRFDSETVRLMGIAFEMGLVVLQRTEGIVNPTRDALAKKIIELAKAGERQPGVCVMPPCRPCGKRLSATPILLRLPFHCRCLRVFELQPVRRAA